MPAEAKANEKYQAAAAQQPAAVCILKSPVDAIHILEAVRLGIVPRVTRRLTGHERSLIRPGTVWVWEEEETNMRRWTDGRRWGASRVGNGGFLVYNESLESLSPPHAGGDMPYGDPYYQIPPRRPDSLVKQTYSTSMTHPVTGKVKKFHVVAYASKHNPGGDGTNPLPQPHQLPALRHLQVQSGIWPEWETRREADFTRRAAAAKQALYAASNGVPSNNPASAPAPPAPQQYPTQPVPPTAYPPVYPQDAYHRPMASPGYHQQYMPSPNVAPLEGGMYPPVGKFTQPYQSPRREPTELYNAGYPPSRAVSQTPTPMAREAAARYHPYGAPPHRSTDRRVSPYPPQAPPSRSTTPVGEYPREADGYGPASWANAPRVSPTQSYSSYNYPRSGEASRPRHFYEPQVAPPYNEHVKSEYGVDPAYGNDPRRYACEEAEVPRRGLTPYQQNPSSYGQPVPSTEDLGQYPPYGAPRSPRASSSQGYSASGVTLPPLRAAFGEESGHNSAKVSPENKREGSERQSQSPTEVGAKPQQRNGWGEDARQLGELGRRMVL
ncbi:hypothetical protein I350_03005 [Cryptococcus amylolentus CBS 6273]|uniref:cAMP-independent regulatory protein pac2 n=1 Tax=Cryptococcus amylolentus CBS 6273 TaxID=1296118 RepID=A0A1E3K8S9_9TREE|nr:hypothetical protein I350_03005 [Cryptococcus amylolentus CBS 6273]